MPSVDLVREFADISRTDLETAGGKGANLGELAGAGFPVPPGFVLTTDAYRTFVRDNIIEAAIIDAARRKSEDPAVLQAAADEIAGLFAGAPVPAAIAEAVLAAYRRLGDRSGSRSARRPPPRTWPRRQLRRPAGHLPQRPRRRRAARRGAATAGPRCGRRGRSPTGPGRASTRPTVSLAVVVQQMVDAEAAGVMFTANPANGRRDEMVITAAWGLGEAVVSGAVNTDDLVVDKATGSVLIAGTPRTRRCMTVYAERRHRRSAGAGGRRRAAGARRRRGGRAGRARRPDRGALRRAAGHRVGARRDGAFCIVQSRPITALPEPTGRRRRPTGRCPTRTAFYVRASIVEQLPDPLTPLFADLIDGSVTRSLQALFARAAGPATWCATATSGCPRSTATPTTATAAAAMARLMLASAAARSAAAQRRRARRRGRAGATHSHPRYVAVGRDVGGAATWPSCPTTRAAGRRRASCWTRAPTYYTAVQTIIPLAATSEVGVHRGSTTRLVRRAGDPPAATFLLGFDSAADPGREVAVRPGRLDREHARARRRAGLRRPTRSTLRRRRAGRMSTPECGGVARPVPGSTSTATGTPSTTWTSPTPVPADDPAPLLDTLRFYLRGAGHRPARAAAAGGRAPGAGRPARSPARLDPVRRRGVPPAAALGAGAAPVREDALADIGLAWPQLRRMLLRARPAAGRRRGDRAARTTCSGCAAPSSLRRADPSAADATPWRERARRCGAGSGGPRRRSCCPSGGWCRAASTQVMPAVVGRADRRRADAGSAPAPAGSPRRPGCSAGPADFGRLRPGDVLVASITTPAWTSLFAMAAGGGHRHRRAAEPQLDRGPRVRHPGRARHRRRPPGGSRTARRSRVDGDAGTVTLLEQQDSAVEPADDHRRSPVPVIAGIAAVVGVGLLIWRRRRRRE